MKNVFKKFIVTAVSAFSIGLIFPPPIPDPPEPPEVEEGEEPGYGPLNDNSKKDSYND